MQLLKLFFIALIVPLTVKAAPLKPEQVPEPLKPWIDWVLLDQPERNCPFLFSDFVQKRCLWPTRLELDLKDRQGQFSMHWTIYRESWASLPGDRRHWPQNVSVDGRPALVIDRNGIPSVRLSPANALAKTYELSGSFRWETLPENLPIPADSALITLTVSGQSIETPSVKDGQLWLQESEGSQNRTDNVQNDADLQVFRKIIDDVPMQIDTRLVLEISGDPRDIRLTPFLPHGFIPLLLQSPLPARLESDGSLTVQTRPGRWQIQLTARSLVMVESIVFKPSRNSQLNKSDGMLMWPNTELWAFEAKPDLRLVEIEQVDAVDPSQTNLPSEWQSLPVYRVNTGQQMVVKMVRRGDPDPEPNQLDLKRQLWLDFDGGGYTVNDTINGTMSREWRLNAATETELGRVVLNGANQLITQTTDSHRQGVEVRMGGVSLLADSRVKGPIGRIDATGWDHRFRSVRTELNLPAGWRLFAAQGVDNVPDSWLSRWTLLDFFLVLITAMATCRLWSPAWGLLALATLVLIWHESDAPKQVWLHILAATTLIRVLPAGRMLLLARLYQRVFWLVLVVTAVPFIINQIRTGLYPQLEKPWQTIIQPQRIVASMLPGAPGEKASLEENSLSDASSLRSTVKKYASDALSDRYNEDRASFEGFERIDPSAKVQTGPGVPKWHWHSVQLLWNGSVDAGQKITLWYLTPTLNAVLNLLRVGLLSMLALLVFGLAERWHFRMRTLKALLLWWFLAPMFAFWPTAKSYADFPDAAMLEVLKNRLLVTPECLPGCVQIESMNLSLADSAMELVLQVHAQESVSLPLPADYHQWFPTRVTVDGQAATMLYRQDGALWLGLAAGLHRVTLSGKPPRLAKFVLPLPIKPGRVDFQGDGWNITGLQANGIADQQLQLLRSKPGSGSDSAVLLAPGVLPPLVRVERTLHLGLDWRISTLIVRVSPPNAPVVLALPLWPGESVTTAGIQIKDRQVQVNMPFRQSEVRWESVLKKTDTIALTASPSEHWVEIWRADVSPIWHVEASGLAMMHMAKTDRWLPEWHPWPGETVALKITRPLPAKGQTLTIENSRLDVRPGLRSRDVDLSLTLTSSQGGQHVLMLPEALELQAVEIDGRLQPIRQEDRKLTIPIKPGEQHVTARWRQEIAMASVMTTPTIDLGQSSVNAEINVSLGEGRWVLLTQGPDMGPAVLFWGVLIAIFLISTGLQRLPLTPLKYRQWFFLLIGLSQIPVVLSTTVILWLLSLGWRKDKTPSNTAYFNGLQVVLATMTFLSLVILFFAVSQGLLSGPDMSVAGNQSSSHSLHWYQDRSAALLPAATVISVPVKIYRALMLAWSLWLAISLVDWLKWGWGCFSAGGLWLKRPPKPADEVASTHHR